MYRFEMPEEEEKIYDLRAIKCGGWFGSRMTSRRHGNWTNFQDSDTGERINMPEKIDYDKKYKPPRKRARTELAQIDSLNPLKTAIKSMPAQTVREIAKNILAGSSLASLPADRNVNVMIPPVRERTSLNKSKKSSRRGNVESSRSVESRNGMNIVPDSPRFPTIVPSTCDFSFVKFPKTPRIVNKRKGTDPEKFPFRVSTLYLEELHNLEEERKRKQQTSRRTPRRTLTGAFGNV